jgi:hypothetical protein
MKKHLHFGYYPKGVAIKPKNAIDPRNYLKTHVWPSNTYVSN